MDSGVIASIISSAAVVIVAVTSLIVSAKRDNRRDAHQAAEARAQREITAAELNAQRDEAAATRSDEYEHQRTERSYADRRDAITAFLAEVDAVVDRAGNAEYMDEFRDNRGAPIGWAEPLELYALTHGVEQTRSKIDLLASPECRDAARTLQDLCTKVATSWEFEGLDEAREIFIDRARRDLALPQYPRAPVAGAVARAVKSLVERQ